jgi:acyl carrier protein
MTVCVKRESLFFKPLPNYKYALQWSISASPVQAAARSTRSGGSEMHALNADVQNRILALVKAILEQNSISSDVVPESRLVDVGLTSMDMVNLMLSVEAEFDFTIPQAEITPENFQSVKTLERMIVAQLQPQKAA